MALKKNPKYDLKRKYSRVLEISIIISILFLIAAFKYFPDLKTDTALKETAQDLVNMEDVLITNQSAPPPPPPKPPILIESPTDDYLDDIEIQDTELDVNEVITGPPPPPVDDDEEALKAVKSTLFSPGKQRGKPVKVQVTVPVKFVLR